MILTLDTEEAAWTALKSLLDGSLKAADVDGIDFNKAKWARFDYKLNGDRFNQSLTASVMSGIIDYQNAFYKTVSLLVKNDGRISKLTDIEKTNFELIFKINKGSSEVESEAKNPLINLATVLSQKMSGKQLLIAILVGSLLYFGNSGFSAYLNFEAENIKGTEHHQELKDLMAHDAEMVKTISKAVKASDTAAEVKKQNFEAFESIIKRSDGSDGVQIQGRSISKPAIDQINKQTRRSAKDVYFKERVQILAVDSSNVRGFSVKMEIIDDGTIVNVAVDDAIIIAKYRKVLQEAEWGKYAINAEFSGRQIGSDIQDARLIRAWRIRVRKS